MQNVRELEEGAQDASNAGEKLGSNGGCRLSRRRWLNNQSGAARPAVANGSFEFDTVLIGIGLAASIQLTSEGFAIKQPRVGKAFRRRVYWRHELFIGVVGWLAGERTILVAQRY
jgi:hypothetical protein